MIPIEINIDIDFLKDQINPDISLCLDTEILLRGAQNQDRLTWTIRKILEPGDHRLEIFCHNIHKANANDPDMAVIVNQVRFQHIDHDFKLYSTYRPDYPESLITHQQSLNQTCASEIYSNYLCWNGCWFLNFKVPIYRWAHEKIGLGWLI